jgi:hypothetical protein
MLCCGSPLIAGFDRRFLKEQISTVAEFGDSSTHRQSRSFTFV